MDEPLEPDVFETPDVPTIDLQDAVEVSDDVNIQSKSIPFFEAAQSFDLLGKKEDDKLQKRLTAANRCWFPHESLEQRIRRLQQEIRDVSMATRGVPTHADDNVALADPSAPGGNLPNSGLSAEFPEAVSGEVISDLKDQLAAIQSSLNTLELSSLSGSGSPGASLGVHTVKTRSLAQVKKLVENIGKVPQVDPSGPKGRNQPETLRKSHEESERSGVGCSERDALLTYELYYSVGQGRSLSSAALTSLEQRVSKLENLIGIHTSKIHPEAMTESIMSVVADLEGKINILSQPKNLANLHKRMKLLIADMEHVVELRTRASVADSGSNGVPYPGPRVKGDGVMVSPTVSRLGDGPSGSDTTDGTKSANMVNKVNQLHDLLAQVEPMVDELPTLLQRMETLRPLFTEASSFSDSLKHLMEAQDMVERDVKDAGKVVKELQEGLQDNVARIGSNMQALGKRIEDMESRVKGIVE